MEGLTVENLTISFGGLDVLKKVSLQVNPGEIVGLIGPNGAGKTSLINCVSRYYQPKSGKLRYNGVDLLTKRPHQLLGLGIARTFQELDLQPSLSVIEALLVGQHSQIRTSILRSIFDFNYLKTEERKYRRKAREIMRFFATVRKRAERPQSELGYPDLTGRGGYPDLLDVQDTSVDVLPYGVKKKVDLARAMVSSPGLLLLDEPACGLGMSDLKELVDLIRSAKKKFNMSVLLVEHQMPMVMELCDRIIVLSFGEKIGDGTPKEIRESEAVVKAYLGSSAEARSIPEIRPTLKDVSDANRSKSAEPILEVREVDLNYGPIKALSGISMKIPAGEIVAILGSNGAGKSSLLKAISGVERLSGGEIHFQGERIANWVQEPRPDRIVRHGVIHVAEGRRIFKELSIIENLKVAGYTLGSRKKVAQNMEKVFHYFPKLKEHLKLHEAGNLSGGLQQMLAISQALILEPKLLLLDEPSLGLAPTLVSELFDTIVRINQNEGCTTVVVEQNTDIVLRIASYAYVIETGYVVKQGRSNELLHDKELRKLYLGA